ncbi:hypothetical protein G6M64_08985 [Agrobacterium tumefaciens]|uniref:hypothetical protein n=1 Tax=Agrobacterium tumefaciens TaxID=358 RepID=UPI0015749491|nr:hypothetical protein [Agrobacterium tumefaciens]NSZ03277.1 hypothetical protein [Agrobacterium tumefaciens]NSZ36665.1 hypothetical protein [Agrobacterium tumefaciens]NTA84771.1 hypothetical protein [Agrobacterium tumefaciens]NTB24727.1 hypothetical protein [Agrobacterium tumefaciens]NTB27527.1 hypothetical protein [Agrobacterium tumefaciens]
MNLNLRLRTILGLFAAAMTIFNLFTMTPAVASSRQHCTVSTAEKAVDGHQHEHSKAPPGCCDSMHCCPIPSRIPSPTEPFALRYQPLTHHEVEEPLLLVTSIDPPPRPANS